MSRIIGYAIISESQQWYYGGEYYDNGTYGSGYRFHSFEPNQIHRFNSIEEARAKLDEISKDEDFLISIPISPRGPHSRRGILGEIKVVPLTIGY